MWERDILGQQEEKAVKAQVSRTWAPDKPQPSIAPVSRAMPSLDVLQPLYQLLHLAAQSTQAPFSQIQLVSCPCCHAGLWATDPSDAVGSEKNVFQR